MSEIFISREVLEKIKPSEKIAEQGQFSVFGIKVRQSSIFPFELSYPACDIKTKEEVNILSGEMCHGVIFSEPITFEETPPVISFYEPPSLNDLLHIRVERSLFRW